MQTHYTDDNLWKEEEGIYSLSLKIGALKWRWLCSDADDSVMTLGNERHEGIKFEKFEIWGGI